MMNWYNGFDALDAREYDEVMEALAIAEMEDEMAEQAAADYFQNELEKDGQSHSLFDVLDATMCDKILEDLALAESEKIMAEQAIADYFENE